MKKLILLLCICVFTSCYRVKEYHYLDITFDDSGVKQHFLEYYIDSVRNKNLIIPDSVSNIFDNINKLDTLTRLVYFDRNPREWYMVNFSSRTCWIQYIYNKKLSDKMLNERFAVKDSELRRIELRFRNEILLPAERYARSKTLPDSLVYYKQ